MSDEQRGDLNRLAWQLLLLGLRMIQQAGGSMNVADLRVALENNSDISIPKWARELCGNGGARWWVDVQYKSSGAVHAEFLRKKGGRWFLTPDGESVLKEPDEDVVAKISSARKRVRHHAEMNAAQAESPISEAVENADAFDDDSETEPEVSAVDILEQREAEARNSIRDRIEDLGAYDFQDLVAALLRGMGYYVRDNAAPGPDDGIDIFAYTDPLGARGTRLKVQVKSREKPAPVEELRELKGLLNEGEIGVFVSSGGFSAPSKKFAATTDKHIELIDMDRFIDLWCENYDKMSDEDRALLPLKRIAFYASKAGV